MKVLGIYHNKDLDGFACGAIIKHKYPQADLFGFHYGDDVEAVRQLMDAMYYDLVIMADVSFPMDEMLDVAARCNKFVWVDHHVSAKNDFDAISEVGNSVIEYVYDNKIAACEGLWKYLFPEMIIPNSIFLLGKYDTWRQHAELHYPEFYYDWQDALCFQMGMKMPDNYSIDGVLRQLANYTDVVKLINEGRLILSYQDAQSEKYAKAKGYVRQWEGLRALVVVGGEPSSRAFESVWNPDLHDLCASCYYDGEKWSYSLRTMKDGVDVSVIAKKYGGGGHVKASGFSNPEFLFK